LNSVLQKAIALLVKTRTDFQKVGESLADTGAADKINDISNEMAIALNSLHTSMAELNTQISKTPMDPKDKKEPQTPDVSAQKATTSSTSVPITSTRKTYTPNVTPGLGKDLEAPIPYDPNEKTNKLDASVPTFDGRSNVIQWIFIVDGAIGLANIAPEKRLVAISPKLKGAAIQCLMEYCLVVVMTMMNSRRV
jgi:hypothetical protein